MTRTPLYSYFISPHAFSDKMVPYSNVLCEVYQSREVIVPTVNEQNNSCTARFSLENRKWKKASFNDGRRGIFGGALITYKAKDLIYLGGRMRFERDNSGDGLKKLSGQEYAKTGQGYTWYYRELEEPSMYDIYQYNGKIWKRWINKLPLLHHD